MDAKPKTKSPLKSKPLRNPGQGVQEEIDRLVNDQSFGYFIFPLGFLLLTVNEWIKWYSDAPPNPVIFSVITVMITAYCVYRLLGLRKRVRHLRQGRDGEKAVGQYLETLRESGVTVYHDVPGDGFNIDHVLIASSGIYCIETKTYSKPERGETVILYDGESVFINRKTRTDKPIVQAVASSRWLADLLKESTGKALPVRPVVTFPGWFIEPTAEAKSSNVWVLNPKALPAFIQNSRTHLTDEDQKLAGFHLSRYIRSKQ